MKRTKQIEFLFIAIALVLGFINAWASRHAMNPDGISYIEIGQAYMRGDFAGALNAWWSPLYSLILGLALALFNPTAYGEFTLVHMVNFGIFVVALFSFRFMLKELLQNREWIFFAFGYAIFILVSLGLITLTIVTPDLLVSALVYLAVGLALRSTWPAMFLLGVVLGFGYLAKAPMIIIALFVLVGLVVAQKNYKKALFAFVVFLIVVLPYIYFLSAALGRVTFGESGKINYAWYTVGPATHIHWQGDNPLTGTPKHPTRKIFNSPMIYEFASPVAGSYPPWYDPAYWNDGMRAPFNFWRQLRVLTENTREYYYIFTTVHISLVTALIVLLLLGGRFSWQSIRAHAVLFLPALAALSMFSLVLVRDRYVAPFVALLWLGIFAAIKLPNNEDQKRFTRSLLGAVVLMMLVSAIVSYIPDIYRTTRDDVLGKYDTSHAHWQIVDGLLKLGVQKGDRMAFIGHEQSGLSAYWAHIAGVKIVAEIPAGEDSLFWSGDDVFRNIIYAKIKETGAHAVVSEYLPRGVLYPGWKKIGDTKYYFYRL